MHLTSILLTISALTAQIALGFVIPDAQEPGVYAVHVLDDGTEQHIRIGDLPTSIPENYTTLGLDTFTQKNDVEDWKVVCFPEEGNQDLDHRTTDIANAALDVLCGDGQVVHKGFNVYAISECVVAYYCHSPGFMIDDDSLCYAGARGDTSLMVSRECGEYKPGMTRRSVGKVPNRYSEAYGYESYCTAKGHNFCNGGVNGGGTPDWD